MIDGNTLMTFSLILANIALYIMTSSNTHIMDACKHYPFQERQDKSYYRWITSGFLHANLMHLALNLFVLYQFGGTVEAIFKGMFGFAMGGIFYLLTYFTILVLSGLPTYLKFKNNRNYSSVGASGVISGILFIYILYFPLNLLFILGLVPIPAALFGILYLFFSKWASGRYDDMIDHDAHYYGAIAGLVIGCIIKFLL
ncbi:MAG: rhomboid family intramembrane serine protease [Saprospiraceae bacterium]|nr:rhomboid family intramembrane serine protease [Saprospiraceae bacterium]